MALKSAFVQNFATGEQRASFQAKWGTLMGKSMRLCLGWCKWRMATLLAGAALLQEAKNAANTQEHSQLAGWIESIQMDTTANVQTTRTNATTPEGRGSVGAGDNERGASGHVRVSE